MSTWQAGWVFSSLIAIAVWRFAVAAGLSRTTSLILGSVWFLSPLGYLIGGSNSIFYLFDLLVPLYVYMAGKHWQDVPSKIRWASFLLFFAVGFMPVYASIGYATAQTTFLLAGINLYRSLGAFALLAYFSATRDRFRQDILIAGFGIATLIIFTAMLLQGQGILNSNILETIRVQTTAYTPYDNDVDQKFIVLGMFRATLGFNGLIGIALPFVNQVRTFSWNFLLCLSASLAGLGILILSGSKTSLICVAVLMAWYFVSSNISARAKSLVVATSFSLFIAIAFIATNEFTKEYIPPLLYETIMSGGKSDESRTSVDERFLRNQKSWDQLNKSPEIFSGYLSLYSLEGLAEGEVNIGYFHNEYFGLMILGGVPSVLTYFSGICIIMQSLFSRLSKYSIFQNLGCSLFLSGLIQALSVAHLQPSILFTATVAILCTIYGLGSIPLTARRRITSYRKDVYSINSFN
jgi:hypothetical protein